MRTTCVVGRFLYWGVRRPAQAVKRSMILLEASDRETGSLAQLAYTVLPPMRKPIPIERWLLSPTQVPLLLYSYS